MTCVTFLSAPLCLRPSASDLIVFDFPLNGFTSFLENHWRSVKINRYVKIDPQFNIIV